MLGSSSASTSGPRSTADSYVQTDHSDQSAVISKWDHTPSLQEASYLMSEIRNGLSIHIPYIYFT